MKEYNMKRRYSTKHSQYELLLSGPEVELRLWPPIEAEDGICFGPKFFNKIYMSKKLFARVAGRHSRILMAGKQDWYLCHSAGHPRTWTLHKFKTYRNSILWQAIAVFHPEDVGATLIEFTQKLAYVTASRRNPNRLVWSRELKTANHRKIILTWI
jgi:hypothetical protein